MAGGGEQKSLEQTPTWAVAAVCTVFVVASLLVERVLKYMGNVCSHLTLFHIFESFWILPSNFFYNFMLGLSSVSHLV